MELPGKLFLAPMAELTTPALRQTVKEFCPDVILFSEMLSSGAIVSRSSHNEPLVKKYSFDSPFIYQIAGSRPEIMAEACSVLSENGCYSIDINMGCPKHDIIKKGQGARLLTDIDRAREIISLCRKTTRTLLSVKMRSGFSENNREHYIDFIKMLEDEGVDFITVHPRYAKLGFSRKADWSFITLARQHVSVPVIGNGDIVSPELCSRRMEETGCHGIMIGREAVKSPWIFRLCSDRIKGIDTRLRVNIRDTFINTLDHIESYLPVNLHKSRGHRFCFYFCRNAVFSHEIFTKIRRCDSIELMKEIVNDYFDRNNHEIEKTFMTGGKNIHETH